jgi:hypothetical protein
MIAVPTASEITEQSLSTLVDLSRYPIANSKPKVRAALVKSCQQQLAKTGCARLPAFLNPDARMAMVDEVDGRLSQVDRTSDWQNPYLSDDDESLPSEHPVRKFHYRKNAFLCRDRFAAGDWVDGLFERMELLNFVRDCLGLKQLYHYDDLMSGYLINIKEMVNSLVSKCQGNVSPSCWIFTSIPLIGSENGKRFSRPEESRINCVKVSSRKSCIIGLCG